MNIKISYYGQSRQFAGSEHELLDVAEDATVPAVIEALARKHGADFANLLLAEDGTLRKSVMLARNGEIADLQSVLNANDEISIYPAVSGG